MPVHDQPEIFKQAQGDDRPLQLLFSQEVFKRLIILAAIYLIEFLCVAAKEAMDLGRSPIIIDNTNTQAWEMKPYVKAVNKAATFNGDSLFCLNI